MKTNFEALYEAYLKKDCNSFKKIWAQLTKEEKQSPYFSYYQSLKAKLCPSREKKHKILLKGKTIKCPHCGSPLTLSEYNKEQIKKLKQGASQVEFICNYCGEKFVWGKQPFKTLFTNYKVGQEIYINGKKYKLAGAVKYKGTYKEYGESGDLIYIEWIAYTEKGDLIYISESIAKDDEGIYKELEVSKKIDFPFTIDNYTEYGVYTIENGNYYVKEYDEVEVKQIYGEVNKGYKIGEKVKLYNFDKYVLEEEKTENGIERNLYEIIDNKEEGNIINTSSYSYSNNSSEGDDNSSIWIFTLFSRIVCPLSIFITVPLIILFYKYKKYKFIISIFFVAVLILSFVICFKPSSSGGGYSSSSGGSYSSWGSSSFGGGK